MREAMYARSSVILGPESCVFFGIAMPPYARCHSGMWSRSRPMANPILARLGANQGDDRGKQGRKGLPPLVHSLGVSRQIHDERPPPDSCAAPGEHREGSIS